jgi:hypothetical protein
MNDDAFEVGGGFYPAKWVRARVSPTPKPDEVLVRFYLPNLVVPATFYVNPGDVQLPNDLAVGEEGEGLVRVALIVVREDSAVIRVPGEAANYGPRLLIPNELLFQAAT